MSDAEERDFALSEADRMRILASEYRQMGFKALAAFCSENANRALKYAARPQDRRRRCIGTESINA